MNQESHEKQNTLIYNLYIRPNICQETLEKQGCSFTLLGIYLCLFIYFFTFRKYLLRL